MTPNTRRGAASLSSARDFKRVYAEGKKARRDGLVLYAASSPGAGASRLGLSVGTRVGNAVTRNRLRRRLRDLFRAAGPREGYDIVIVASPGAAERSFAELEAAVRSALDAIGAAS